MNWKRKTKKMVTMLLVTAFALNVGVAPKESGAKKIITEEQEKKLQQISYNFPEYFWLLNSDGSSKKINGSYAGKCKVYKGCGGRLFFVSENYTTYDEFKIETVYIVKEGNFVSYIGTDKETFDKMKLIAKQKKAKKSVPKSKRINKGLACTYDEPNEYGILFPKDHKGKTIKLQAGYKAKMKINGKSKAKWKSSKKSVATVSSKGVVTANHKGTTTITGKVGKKTYKCKIKVRPVDIDYVYTGVPELNDNLKSSPTNPIVVKNGTVLNIGFKKGTVLGLFDSKFNKDAVKVKYINQNKREYAWNMTYAETKPHQKSKKLKKFINKICKESEKNGGYSDIDGVNPTLGTNYRYGMVPREKMSDTIGTIRFDNVDLERPSSKANPYDGGIRAVTFKARWALSATHLRAEEFTIYVRWEK